MPLSYELRDGVLRYSTVADVDFDPGTEVLEAGLCAAAGAAPDHRWALLFDVRQSQEDRNSSELHYIARVIGDHREILSGKCAIVVSEPAFYGMGRMMAAYLLKYDIETQVFHEVEVAEVWLRSPDLT